MKFSQRIRRARRSAKLSQEALGKQLGVQRSAVSNWEGGVAVPTAGNLLMLAELAKVSFEWLALGRGSMKLAPSAQPIPAVEAVLIYEPDELQLIEAYRSANGRQKLRLLQLAEAYAPKHLHLAVAQKSGL